MSNKRVMMCMLETIAFLGILTLFVQNILAPPPKYLQTLTKKAQQARIDKLPYPWSVYSRQSQFFGKTHAQAVLEFQAPKMIEHGGGECAALFKVIMKDGERLVHFYPGLPVAHKDGGGEAWVTFSGDKNPMHLTLIPDKTYRQLRIKESEAFLSRAERASSMIISYQTVRSKKFIKVEFPLGPLPKALKKLEDLNKKLSPQ
jgi:hypothetical protein